MLPHAELRSITPCRVVRLSELSRGTLIVRKSVIPESPVITPEVMTQTPLMRNCLRLLYCTLNEGEC